MICRILEDAAADVHPVIIIDKFVERAVWQICKGRNSIEMFNKITFAEFQSFYVHVNQILFQSELRVQS